MDGNGATEPQGKLLHAWQLAVLRFAVTLDDGDRLHALALAGEVDRMDGRSEGCFRFFRRTSAELCHAICADDAQADAVVLRFLAQVEDVRLKRALAAAIAKGGTKPTLVAGQIKRQIKPRDDLWKGLPPRRTARM